MHAPLISRRGLLLAAAAPLAGLTGCVTIPGAPTGTKSDVVYLKRQVSGAEVTLKMDVFLPPGNGPFEAVLYNHGGRVDNIPNNPAIPDTSSLVGFFLQHGYAVLRLERQGRGSSTGRIANSSCSLGQSHAGFQSDYQDVMEAVRYIDTSPIFRKGIVTVGHSRGGLLSGALASREPGLIRRAVGLGSGWQAVGAVGACPNGQQIFDDYLEFLASRSSAPALHLYAANDSYHPPASVQQGFAKHRAAGGTWQVETLPFVSTPGGDGHFLHQRPDAWGARVLQFLRT